MPISITAYQGRAGDRNDLAWPGALMIAEAVSSELNCPFEVVGEPKPPLNQNWELELAAAASDLSRLADRIRLVLSEGGAAFTALNRCAAAIATLPAVCAAHPDAAIVWFDAHADLNTPATTSSGYLGGMALSGPAGLWRTGFGGPISLGNVILVGSRDLDPFEAQLIAAGEVAHVSCQHENIPGELLRLIRGRPVYVHFDCDVLEPGLIPTDFQVPGGLTFAQLTRTFEALATLRVIGIEVAEFQARWAPDGESASATELLRAMKPLLEAARDA